jgi:flagellar basal body-associated protein FliL
MNDETPRKKSLRLYLVILGLLLLIGGSVYGYFRYRSFINLQESAEAVIEENEKLKQEVGECNELKEAIAGERSRCEKILLQEEGNFAEFSYCQRLLDFIGALEVDL